MKHITKDGQEIELRDLGLSHLENIVKMKRRQAESGLKIQKGGGGHDIDSWWYDEEMLFGEAALLENSYYKYKKELESRV